MPGAGLSWQVAGARASPAEQTAVVRRAQSERATANVAAARRNEARGGSMSASISNVGAVLRALPGFWRRAANALDREWGR